MARSVTFNGVTLFKPGGITKVNADALNQVTLSANSIVGIIGEAEGGEPGSSAGLVSLDDPSRASALFREGPLVDAIRTAFQASNDPDVPGGASRVLVYKTNSSTASSVSLPTEELTPIEDQVASGGSTTTVVDTTLGSTYADDELNGKLLVLRPFTSTCEVRTITDYVAGTQTMTVATLANAAANLDEYFIFENEVEAMDAVIAGSSTSTSIALKDVDLSDDQYNGRWVYIQNTASVSYLRKITDTVGSSDSLTISPALPAAPTAGAFVQILPNSIDFSSKDYGAHTNDIKVDLSTGLAAGSKVLTVTTSTSEEVSPDLGGKVLMKLLYQGGAQAASDTVAASPASTTTDIQLTTGGLTVNAEAGKQVLINGEYSRIVSNTANTLTLSPALSAAPASTDAVSIRTVTGGTMVVDGAAGAATSLSTTISGVTGDNLSISFSANQTLRQLVSAINQNPNYSAVISAGVNGDTTLVKDLDFGLVTEANILASTSIATEGLTRNVMAIVDWANDFSELVSATRTATTGSSHSGGRVPNNTEDPGVSLTGGTRGTSSNSSFQAGFDKLLLVRCNSVVPLIDEDLTNEGYGSTATVASVAAQLAAHVALARGAAQNVAGERGGFLGFRGTKTELIAQANDINDMDVAICAQNPTILDASGSLVEFGPRMQAVQAASMRAGVAEVGEPLTHKLIRTSGYTQDASWDPQDLTDANDLIRAGVLFAETVDGVGTRWVRDITTWVVDDNLAYMEGSVRDVVRFVAWDLRSTLVRRFTGKKASPATIANIKDVAVSVLEVHRQNNIIVDSTDPATGARVNAYHNLRVTSSGDTARVNVGIFPVPGINFMLNEIFLQLPTQAA